MHHCTFLAARSSSCCRMLSRTSWALLRALAARVGGSQLQCLPAGRNSIHRAACAVDDLQRSCIQPFHNAACRMQDDLPVLS